MCRWLAYMGSELSLDDLLFKPAHSLIDQSLDARLGDTVTNGDGFGVGWYGKASNPALFRSVEPVWNDLNLKNIAPHIRSSLVFAHIRASTGSATQQTNCHPFKYGRWLWMHNGLISDFQRVKRDLAFAVDPSLYADIKGTTDSELFFYLALTFGLQDRPRLAVERAVGFIEETCHSHGIENPIQMTVATSDGERIWVFRYSSEGRSRTLFYSTEVKTLREQYPDNEVFKSISTESRLIVSEPIGDLDGVWREFPDSSCGVIQDGPDELRRFTPKYRQDAQHA